MAEALALLPVGDRVRAFWLTNYADVLDFLGRDVEADAAVREALEIGVRRHDDTTVGMAWWTRSWLAAHRNDPAGLRYALSEVERHRGEWMKDGQLAEYLGSSAEHLLLVGDLVGYHDFIERAADVATHIGFPEVVDNPRAPGTNRSTATRNEASNCWASSRVLDRLSRHSDRDACC